ncbi:unnamed protein product [Closterium sp. Naga37s-1]|nr:unnamed protein product [Closterium sp. Naga37s-1]
MGPEAATASSATASSATASSATASSATASSATASSATAASATAASATAASATAASATASSATASSATAASATASSATASSATASSATASSATASSATASFATASSATAATALPLLDLLQLFLWVAVSPAVEEELLFRGLLLTALQERLGRIDAAMLSAALFALVHLSLSLLFPNMAFGIAAGLLIVHSNNPHASAHLAVARLAQRGRKRDRGLGGGSGGWMGRRREGRKGGQSRAGPTGCGKGRKSRAARAAGVEGRGGMGVAGGVDGNGLLDAQEGHEAQGAQGAQWEQGGQGGHMGLGGHWATESMEELLEQLRRERAQEAQSLFYFLSLAPHRCPGIYASLSSLTLHRLSPIPAHFLSYLRELPSLTSLSFLETSITPGEVQPLERLRELHIRQVSDALLREVAILGRLKAFSCTCSEGVTPRGWEQLKSLTKLTRLQVAPANLEDHLLELQFRNDSLPDVSRVCQRPTPYINRTCDCGDRLYNPKHPCVDGSVWQVAGALQGLQQLGVHGVARSEEDLLALTALTSLTTLHITGTHLHDDAYFRDFSELRELGLAGCSVDVDSGMAVWSYTMPQLQSLDLSATRVS